VAKFQPFPYTDSKESYTIKEYFRRLGVKILSNNAPLLSGWLGFWTVAGGAITGSTLPTGWTIARSAAGVFVVTHNQNFQTVNTIFNYYASAIPQGSGTLSSIALAANTFTITFSADVSGSFIVAVNS
jgi:hypothetical protein